MQRISLFYFYRGTYIVYIGQVELIYSAKLWLELVTATGYELEIGERNLNALVYMSVCGYGLVYSFPQWIFHGPSYTSSLRSN